MTTKLGADQRRLPYTLFLSAAVGTEPREKWAVAERMRSHSKYKLRFPYRR